MTADYTNQITAGLLLLSLVSALAIGILGTFLLLIHTRRGCSLRASSRPKRSRHTRTPYRPSVFDHACRWAVVRSSNVGAVQTALGLHNPMPCSWGEGMSRLMDQRLFVSPPVQGWILVIGQGLPDPAVDVDECFHLVIRLSRALGHAQFYSVNHALNHHAWARAEGGRIRRAYAWGGETLWNQGELTQAEIDLELDCCEYGEPGDSLSSSGPQTANTEKVILLAARWSFDPTAVDERLLRPALGVAGHLGQTKPH